MQDEKRVRRFHRVNLETPDHSGRPDDASSSGEDEAEFAWLPVDCLKPFQPGDAAVASEVDPSRADNANLRACVAAAGKVSVPVDSRCKFPKCLRTEDLPAVGEVA